MAIGVGDKIVAEVGERIRTGLLEPGHPLRQEHIAREFDTSPGPVREAFRKLEAQGLVLSRPRRGVIVAEINTAGIIEMSEMRAALESLALQQAFPYLTKSDFSAARAILNQKNGNDIKRREEANRSFHRTLISPCQMPRLMHAIDDLHMSASRILLAMWRDLPGWAEKSDQDHHAILASLELRDIDAATAKLRKHIRDGGHTLITWLETKSS